MTDEMPAYIRVSVNAVGGPDTEAGKEMRRLLMDRAGVADAPTPVAAPKAAIAAPAASGDALMPGNLESIFADVLAIR